MEGNGKIIEDFKESRLAYYKKFVNSKRVISVRELNLFSFCDLREHDGLVLVYDNMFHICITEKGFHVTLDKETFTVKHAEDLHMLETKLFDWVSDNV